MVVPESEATMFRLAPKPFGPLSVSVELPVLGEKLPVVVKDVVPLADVTAVAVPVYFLLVSFKLSRERVQSPVTSIGKSNFTKSLLVIILDDWVLVLCVLGSVSLNNAEALVMTIHSPL